MSHTPKDGCVSEAGSRGRFTCMLFGSGYYVLGFAGGSVMGIFGHLFVTSYWIFKPKQLESAEYLFHEVGQVALLGLMTSFLVGAWMGSKSYGLTAISATGIRPNPPFFTRMLSRAPRGVLALLASYFVPRWKILVGESAPWHWLPRSMAIVAGVTAIVIPKILEDDSDLRLSISVCGGLGCIISDCLLVNSLARWRERGWLKIIS